MIKVAITGGIASGKSTVSGFIKGLGYKVYDADKIYADLLKDEVIVANVSRIAGVRPLKTDGKLILDKKAVSQKVFSDKDALDRLNAYTHKLIYDEIEKIIRKEDKEKILFFEIPLLFESGKADDFDKIIVVARDKTLRIKALETRNGLSEDEAMKRIISQTDYDNFDFSKHTLIRNDGDLSALRKKVSDVVKSFEEDNANF